MATVTRPSPPVPGRGSASKSGPRKWTWRPSGLGARRLAGAACRHDGYLGLVVYLALALIWYRSVVAHMGSACACSVKLDPGDNADSVWWLGWFVHALADGLPVFHPNVIWSPTGINLAGSTVSPLLALLGAPVTILWGPIVTYNLLMITAPALAAWSANRLCRQISGSAAAALLAGATYGFSSYEIGHLLGHLQLVVALCPPLVALCAVRLMDGSLSPRRYVAVVTGLISAQILISAEVAFTMTLVAALGIAAVWVSVPAGERARLRARLPTLALPWLLAAAATAWFTIPLLGAPAYAAGVASAYPTDALSFLLPMPYTWLGGTWLSHLTYSFIAGWDENTAYLGPPLLAILGAQLWRARRTPAGRALTLLTGVLVVWILGPVLYIDGRPVARLLYALAVRLPLFSEMIPGRLSLYLALVAAVALALWLARPHRHPVPAWLVGLAAVAALMPNLASATTYNVSRFTEPRFFTTELYRRYVRPGQTLLPLPWGSRSQAYVWQAQDHFYWRLASGYFRFAPLASWPRRIATDLWSNVPSAGDGPRLQRLITGYHVADVVVLQGDLRRWQATLHAAGLRRVISTGGVTIYRL